MKPKDLLVELESAAQSLDVKVSYESIASMVVRGGLCKVKGQYRVIIDKRLNLEERANMLSKSLAKFDLSEIEIAKPAMALLQYYAARLKRPRSANAATAQSQQVA